MPLPPPKRESKNELDVAFTSGQTISRVSPFRVFWGKMGVLEEERPWERGCRSIRVARHIQRMSHTLFPYMTITDTVENVLNICDGNSSCTSLLKKKIVSKVTGNTFNDGKSIYFIHALKTAS